MDLSFQKKKNGLEICFLVPEISNKYKGQIFNKQKLVLGLVHVGIWVSG